MISRNSVLVRPTASEARFRSSSSGFQSVSADFTP